MKKLIYILLAAAALLPGLQGCKEKEEKPGTMVDLRYRVEDSYELDAVNARAFSITVTSTDPWTVTSRHPDWCIIETEEGEGSDPDMVRVGKGEKTTLRVQYYDNTELDDRIDYIDIRTETWHGKTVTIKQKGIAYLTVAEEAVEIEKDGGEVEIHIAANQDWSAAVTEGDNWLSIEEGATGTLDGVITLFAKENPGEMRYAAMVVYDRHNVLMATVNFTQDGVLLDPETLEIRAGYDQPSAELRVSSNAEWKAVKDNENDTWYTIENPDHDGDGVIRITLKENTGDQLRSAGIILKTVSDDPEAFTAERIITLKQAYKINPVRVMMDNDEMSKWKSDKTNTPVYTAGVGMLFPGYARLNNGSMAFGSYTFRWSNISADALIRLWFCYSDGEEIKYNLNAASGKTAVSVNKGSGADPGMVNTTFDPSVPHEMTYKFDPSGSQYCHVTLLLDGVEFTSFDSSPAVMPYVLWGKSVNMYLGVETGSAVLEWYEYTPPMNWDE